MHTQTTTGANADESIASDDNLTMTCSTMMPIAIADGVLLATDGSILFWARRRKA